MAQAEPCSLETYEPIARSSNNYPRESSNISNERVHVVPSSSGGQSDIERDHALPRPGSQNAVVPSAVPSDPEVTDAAERDRAARVAVKEYGINVDQPKHSKFAVLQSRINTFRNWLPSIRQKPRELAEAGFFYAGHGDTVFCFYCGQGLHSWEPEDDVWEEHCRWSSTCPFLLNMKGPDFITMVQLKDTDLVAYNMMKLKLEEKERKNNTKFMPRTAHDGEVNMRNMFIRINDLLARPSAVSVTEFYDKEKTKQAIQTFIKLNGNTNFNAENLMNIIFDIEEGIINYDELMAPEEDGARASEGSNENQQDEETEMLKAENAQLRRKAICTVCHDEIVSVVFLPCGHLCSCADCAPALKDCKACGTFIKGTVRTFLT